MAGLGYILGLEMELGCRDFFASMAFPGGVFFKRSTIYKVSVGFKCRVED